MKTRETDDGTAAQNSVPVRIEERLVYMDSVDFDDKRFQVREVIDDKTVEQYRKVAKQGNGVIRLRGFCTKPVMWQRPDDKKHVICAGWHRLLAGQAEKITEFEADVLVGDENEAMVAAMKSNLTHGLPLKPAEREEAVLRTIQALTAANGIPPSAPEVARQLGISAASVMIYRNKLEKTKRLPKADKVMGKDGKVQAARKKTRGSSRAKADSEEIAGHAKASAPPKHIGQQTTSPDSEDTASDVNERLTDENPVHEKPDGGIDEDPNPDPEMAYIEPLEKALNVMSLIQRRGWSHLEGSMYADRVAVTVAKLVETGEAFLATRENVITPQ